MFVYIFDVIPPRGHWVVSVDRNDLPVELAIVNHSQHTEYFDLIINNISDKISRYDTGNMMRLTGTIEPVAIGAEPISTTSSGSLEFIYRQV
jgi:hypothetical protein